MSCKKFMDINTMTVKIHIVFGFKNRVLSPFSTTVVVLREQVVYIHWRPLNQSCKPVMNIYQQQQICPPTLHIIDSGGTTIGAFLVHHNTYFGKHCFSDAA